jgi:phosphoribosylaminoimidazole-succinocarboxamide synthase
VTAPLFESTITSLPLISRGKVRDIYAVNDEQLLIVTSDRLSAFDVILPNPIPDKGKVLTQIANFWFDKLAHIVPGQLTGVDPESVVAPDEREQVRGRAVVVKRLRPLPIEGAVCGIALPAGLKMAQKLPQPIFTPATKADIGEHDENISFEASQAHCAKVLADALYGTGKNGAELAAQARSVALQIYEEASRYAATKGIIIADTKFEFGIDAKGTLHLIDEALTPDSSRFWPADQYAEGNNPPSFDKQFVRDYLETLAWNKTAPGPNLPAEIVDKTAAKYREAYERLTGQPLN